MMLFNVYKNENGMWYCTIDEEILFWWDSLTISPQKKTWTSPRFVVFPSIYLLCFFQLAFKKKKPPNLGGNSAPSLGTIGREGMPAAQKRALATNGPIHNKDCIGKKHSGWWFQPNSIISVSIQIGIQSNHYHQRFLVGGFNPSEKYESNWIISPSRGENRKIYETTT